MERIEVTHALLKIYDQLKKAGNEDAIKAFEDVMAYVSSIEAKLDACNGW